MSVSSGHPVMKSIFTWLFNLSILLEISTGMTTLDSEACINDRWCQRSVVVGLSTSQYLKLIYSSVMQLAVRTLDV